MKEIKAFFQSSEGRILAKKEYFRDNKTLVEAYDFICAVLKLIDNHEHKPGAKRLLKTN